MISCGGAAECSQCLAIASCGQYADKPTRTLGGRNVLQLAQNPRIIGFVISVGVCPGGLVGRVARGVYAGSALQRVNLQARVVGYNGFSRNILAVAFGFFSRVGLEREAIFNHRRQGREARNAGDFTPVTHSGAGEIAQFARIGSCNENLSHHDFIVATPPTNPPEYEVFHSRNAKTRASREIHPPAVRSQVRTKLICTRFAPASTGTSICPVTSRAPARTWRPFTFAPAMPDS